MKENKTCKAVLPQYKNKHLIKIVEDFINESSHSLNSEDILSKVIDPDCDKEARRYLKNRISTLLANGARQGLWFNSTTMKGYYGSATSKDLISRNYVVPEKLHREIVTKVIELFSDEVGSTSTATHLANKLADFILERIDKQ